MDANIKSLYKQLHSKYPLELKNSKEMGFKTNSDFPVLCGISSLGKFEVFFDDVSFPFYAMRDNGEVFAHWHLQTPDEVEKTVVDFMEGKPSVIPFGQPYNT